MKLSIKIRLKTTNNLYLLLNLYLLCFVPQIDRFLITQNCGFLIFAIWQIWNGCGVFFLQQLIGIESIWRSWRNNISAFILIICHTNDSKFFLYYSYSISKKYLSLHYVILESFSFSSKSFGVSGVSAVMEIIIIIFHFGEFSLLI